MRKKSIALGVLLVLGTMGPLFADFQTKPIDFVLTTDVLELLDEDFQAEFMFVSGRGHAFAARFGYYRTLEDSDQTYPGDNREWELGGRWRRFLMEEAPHFFFIGLGFDNRPADNTITPLAELGFNAAVKPLVISAVTFWGYEIDVKNSDDNRFVKGFELRVGLGF